VKRKTFRRLRTKTETQDHHHVYVVLLKPAAAKLRDSKKPCVYVGMTGLTPKERLANHKAGLKAASVVKKYGVRLLPRLFAHLNPMPYEAALQMEKDLAEDLRREGYTVAGGH
jgi:predicted GIY-YIG superfamily endonuclease